MATSEQPPSEYAPHDGPDIDPPLRAYRRVSTLQFASKIISELSNLIWLIDKKRWHCRGYLSNCYQTFGIAIDDDEIHLQPKPKTRIQHAHSTGLEYQHSQAFRLHAPSHARRSSGLLADQLWARQGCLSRYQKTLLIHRAHEGPQITSPRQ